VSALWIFGYGSLLFRPDFPFDERRPARLHGFARRFFQGSPDHRGTPEQPGRVVTLTAIDGACCDGEVFRIPDANAAETLSLLDHRERGGYARHTIEVTTSEGPLAAVTWIGWPGNPSWIGPAHVEEIAQRVRVSAGESGRNIDYVLRLSATLRALGVLDPHVEELAALLT
jgi:cation transport regulator ChaC